MILIVFLLIYDRLQKNGPASGSTFSVGDYNYSGTGNYDGQIIILNVSTKIEYQKSVCGSDKRTGVYKIYTRKLNLISSSYDYYGYEVKDKIKVQKNKLLNTDDIDSFISLTDNETYKFVGLVEENEAGLPNNTMFSLPLVASESKTYYAVFNKTDITGTTKYRLGQTISGYSEEKEYTFNAFAASNEFNLTNDISYFEKDNIVFFGDKSSTITTDDGKTIVGSKIASGVTINFGLNNGMVTIVGESGYVSDLEPEDDFHTNQYTVCLQSDLYVYGTLVIGANYGTLGNTNYEGHIANEYVTLDLNGHNIYVEGGTLNVFGLIKNSKKTVK